MYACIEVKGLKNAVLKSPLTPIESLGDKWTTYKDDIWPGALWEQLFRTIMAGDCEDEDIQFNYDTSVADHQEVQDRGYVSPRRSIRASAATSYREEDKLINNFSLARTEVINEPVEDAIAELHAQIKVFSGRLKRTEMKQLTYDPVNMDQAIVCLTNKLGNRLDSLDPKSILQHIEHLSEEVQLCYEKGLNDSEAEGVQKIFAEYGLRLHILCENICKAMRAQVNK